MIGPMEIRPHPDGDIQWFGLDYIQHRDGVTWYDAPRPRRWRHKHIWQTRGRFGGDYIERCACGAAHEHAGEWFYIGRDLPRFRPYIARSETG